MQLNWAMDFIQIKLQEDWKNTSEFFLLFLITRIFYQEMTLHQTEKKNIYTRFIQTQISREHC